MAATLEDVAQAGPPAESGVLEWLLDLSDSLLSSRSRHIRSPEWESVVELTLVDPRNPRSATFQLAKLAKHVSCCPMRD